MDIGKELQSLFPFSHRHAIPLVFRGGGTSLSGQCITDGILVDLSRHWGSVEPLAEGGIVRVGPGVTGAMVNARLKTFHRKIGAADYDGYYSSAVNCELAMSEATGKAYASMLRLADKAL